MSRPVCAIIGIGPGNGTALARAFAVQGYRVVLLSRSEAALAELSAQLPESAWFPYDASEPDSARSVFPRIAAEVGPVEVLLYNAGSGLLGDPDEVTLEDLESAWRVNCQGLLAAVQQVSPSMTAVGRGQIVVIGATASVKHSPRFTAFTSAKAAQRALAMALAKHLGPQGVHVSYVIVDGVIDIPRTRAFMPEQPDAFFLRADDIARTVVFLCEQPRSAWSFEVDLRPFAEKW